MGRKARYDTVVPLCPTHHRRYDEYRAPFDDDAERDWLKARAVEIEALWQAQSPSVIRPHDA